MRVKGFGARGLLGFRAPRNPKRGITHKGIDLVWGM
jgi:hypothetical protein